MHGTQRQKFLTIIPPINLSYNDVCQIQSIQPSPTGFYTAKLNGPIGSSFIAQGYSRSVLIKSHGDDLSGGTFEVIGLQNGATVTSGVLAGPAANATVDTTVDYDTITEIKVSDDLIGSEFSATGGGLTYARPFFLNWSNPNTNLMSYGLSVRNPAGRNLFISAGQVFTEGVPFQIQFTNEETYGLFSLYGGIAQAYIYRGVPAPLPDGTSVAYPLWDAFVVAVSFNENDDPRPTVIAFPQIGR